MKRELEVVVISDLHLGTVGCHATELLNYLKSIQPKVLILNGDIIDMWQFKKRYFPKDHMRVLQRILKMSIHGTKVYYVTGNHDDVLRRFAPLSSGAFELCNSLQLKINKANYWVIHGDVFDMSIQYSRTIAKLGGSSYDLLIRVNKVVNRMRSRLGFAPISLAGKAKMAVKEAVKFIDNYEQAIIQMAVKQNCDFVICGHIHQPKIMNISTENGMITYLNSGDWIENLSALEYESGVWSIFLYNEHYVKPTKNQNDKSAIDEIDNEEEINIQLTINDLIPNKASA